MEENTNEIRGINVDRVIHGLLSNDKGIVRNSINEIFKVVNKTKTSEKPILYQKLEKPLIQSLEGNVESCREKAIQTIHLFINDIDSNKNYLTLLIPALHGRVGTDEIKESAEEIRVSIINLLDICIVKYADSLEPYMEDIVAIINQGIKDSAPLVKRSSCKAAVNLSELAPREFYPFTKDLIQPLRDSITHQHWRVRVAVIEAIGSVILHGDSKLLYPETTNVLAKRLFDDTPNVRLAVVKLVGTWLLKLPDRYSFFPHLLPHILTSLADSNEEVKNTAAKYWDLIGDQYLNENEKDYKDVIDLGKQTLDHYPPDVQRPRLGCRCLVQREAYKFLPAISAELSDWLLHVKVKSAQLLSQVILHSESKITQHVQKIIQAMAKSASDQDPAVAHYVKLSAFYMGHFVPVEIYTKLIVDHISDTPSSGELEMVASLVSGSEPCQLIPHLSQLLHLISNSTTNALEQMGMNNLIKAIIDVCKKECTVIGNELWFGIIMNYSLADSDVIAQQSTELLSLFASVHEEMSQKETNIKYSKYLINKLVNTSVWTVHCHQQFIFSGTINIAGEIVGKNIDDILKILEKSTTVDSDAEVVLKMILTSHLILQNHDVTLPDDELVCKFATALINDILLNQLTWRAGRSAEALRSGASLTLLTALNLHTPNNIDKLLPVLLSLVEDALPRTRSLALRSLQVLACQLSASPDDFSKTIQVIIKRLDDCDRGVRELSITTIKSYFQTLIEQDKKQAISQNTIDFIYSTLLIHLDDQDTNIQDLVLDCLTLSAEINPKLLMKKLKSETFRDRQIQKKLLMIIDKRLNDAEIMTGLEKHIGNISVQS